MTMTSRRSFLTRSVAAGGAAIVLGWPGRLTDAANMLLSSPVYPSDDDPFRGGTKLGTLPMSGNRGRAITPMMPSGKVVIDGLEYSARLKSGSADSGDEVIVVGLDAFSLVVMKSDPV